MALPYLELFIQPQPLRVSSFCHSCACPRTLVEYSDHQAIMLKFYCQNSPLKCLPARSAASCYGTRLNLLGGVPFAAMARQSSNTSMSFESDITLNTHYNEDQDEAGGLSCRHSELAMTFSVEEIREFERRRKIGLANKGRVPWNKGKRHSPETLARISEKTRQALRDPKVRRKMSENHRRMHSAHSIEKIRSSLRQSWAKRLKRKRATEKFYSSWTESIAEAARKGGIDEEELNWDSYQRLQEEIASRKLQHEAEKAKEKGMKEIKAGNRAQEKVKKMVSQVKKKKNLEQKAAPRKKQRGRPTKRRNARLTKINGKKVLDGTLCNRAAAMHYLQLALEKLDIESIKKEMCRSRVSLADQIQAAKRKRTQVVASGATLGSSLVPC